MVSLSYESGAIAALCAIVAVRIRPPRQSRRLLGITKIGKCMGLSEMKDGS
jgi:hypothetical protein